MVTCCLRLTYLGLPTRLRPQELKSAASWFEGVSVRFNDIAAERGSVLFGWQTSSAWIWMEAIEEAVGGTAGCIVSGALLTLATLLLFTGSPSLAAATIAGVAVVLICFVGYLAQRGFRLGVIEAVATTIFIGFACDYCVHVCQVHRGGSLARTLAHAGPSLFSAALTTIAAATPLMACRILIFRQMGEFIVVCTSISLGVALSLVAPGLDLLRNRTRRSPGDPKEEDVQFGEVVQVAPAAQPEGMQPGQPPGLSSDSYLPPIRNVGITSSPGRAVGSISSPVRAMGDTLPPVGDLGLVDRSSTRLAGSRCDVRKWHCDNGDDDEEWETAGWLAASLPTALLTTVRTPSSPADREAAFAGAIELPGPLCNEGCRFEQGHGGLVRAAQAAEVLLSPPQLDQSTQSRRISLRSSQCQRNSTCIDDPCVSNTAWRQSERTSMGHGALLTTTL